MASSDFTSWHQFLYRVEQAEKELGSPALLWYRGVSDAKHTLRPSLLRKANGIDKERELFLKYCSLSMPVQDSRPSDWQTLFDMQHYGIPTRLLDWTEVLGIAVFFAMLGGTAADAAVYILDPIALNKKSSKAEIPQVHAPNSDFAYRKIYWDHFPTPPVMPIAIEAPSQNRRIAAQRGEFTVHGTDARPLEEQFPGLVKKVVLSQPEREGARSFLRISGINEFSVFPDIVGLAPFLEALVGLA